MTPSVTGGRNAAAWRYTSVDGQLGGAVPADQLMSKSRIQLQRKALESGDRFRGNDCNERQAVIDENQPDYSISIVPIVQRVSEIASAVALLWRETN